MDANQFRQAVHAATEESQCQSFQASLMYGMLTLVVIKYYDNVQDRRVTSKVEPGYLKKLLPEGPPVSGETWEDIQKDIESKIMPGLTHW